jgi:carboxymethylenebutenolidase
VLTALGVDHDVKEYLDAGHAFLNDHEGTGDRNPLIFVVMSKFAGSAGYHEPHAHENECDYAAVRTKVLRDVTFGS